MREISVNAVKETVARLCIGSNIHLPKSLEDLINSSSEKEESPLGKEILSALQENLILAKENSLPICQDTGMAVIFLEIGQDVHFIDGDLYKAVNEGVAKGYIEGKLRLSILNDPLERINTNTNAPAIIHTTIVSGDRLKIDVCPKGFGSENMSKIKMFTPSASADDIISFVVETVSAAGSNPCPPIIVGVGIGGNFEYSAFLSKKALCRDTSIRNENIFYSELEEKMLTEINSLGIGPQGFGGTLTALAVNIETFPTHIAGLPVAVNIGCHVTRHMSEII